jgi:DNA-binding transcriptional LysR family regulator
MALVAADECAALIPQTHDIKIPEGVKTLHLTPRPLMNAYAVYRKEKYLSDPMRDLINLAREYWTQE